MRSSITLDTRLRIPTTVLSQELAGDTVLLNLRSSTYFGMDPTGTRIWHYLAQGCALGEISTRLAEEYDAQAAQIANDVVSFLRTLSAHGLVEPA